MSNEQSVSVQLNLAARESYFVVVTDKQEKLPVLASENKASKSEVINGEWKVRFDEKTGGPGEVTFKKLEDWTKNTDPRIKYYSGTAVYDKTIWISHPDDEIKIYLNNPGSVAHLKSLPPEAQ